MILHLGLQILACEDDCILYYKFKSVDLQSTSGHSDNTASFGIIFTGYAYSSGLRIPDITALRMCLVGHRRLVGYAVSDSARLKTIQFLQRFVVCLCTNADYTVYSRPA